MKHRNRARKAGLPPGTVVHIGDRKIDHAQMVLIQYDAETLTTGTLKNAAEAVQDRESSSTSWIDVVGLHDTELLADIGRGLGLHSLVMEDIANTDQRPKLEVTTSHIFMVAKMLRVPENGKEGIDVEQVSFVIGPRYLLTFQEKPGDVFEPVRERLRQNKGRIRKAGPDYLAYALLDMVVDNYFVVLERLGDEIDELEGRVMGPPDPSISQRIHRMKRTLLFMRKSTWPLREMITALLREESDLVSSETQPFLRDLYDHTIHVIDTIETHRDMLSGLLEVHLANLNNRMSEVMKVLTIIATIFIPLTFVAGVYGMNFEYMPELGWKWSYPIVLFVMFAIGGGLLAYFRVRKWI